MNSNLGLFTIVVLALAVLVQMDELRNDAEVADESANTPEFLLLATDSQRKEYIELESNMNVPQGMLRKAQDAWASNIGEPVLSAYKEHVATEDAVKAQECARMDRAVAMLSQEAQDADKIIRGIFRNETLTRKEINTLIAYQMQHLPKKVFNELTVALQ